MKAADPLRHFQAKDRSLRWTMRGVGLLLAAASLYFLKSDLFMGDSGLWFFGFSLVLGALTFGASWWPGPQRTDLDGSPALQPLPVRDH